MTAPGRSYHIVLLGDSIFDNAAYVGDEPDVIARLRAILLPGWAASLCAVDGIVAAQLPTQISRIPLDATHLVLSLGGNDALWHEYLIHAQEAHASELLLPFASALDSFEIEPPRLPWRLFGLSHAAIAAGLASCR